MPPSRYGLLAHAGLALLGCALLAGPHPHPAGASPRLVPDRAPLAFEANRGQFSSETEFVARTGAARLVLCRGAALSLLGSRSPAESRATASAAAQPMLSLCCVGADPSVRASGVDPLPGKSNYLFGRDPRRWRRNVPNFRSVRYDAVYPGIDLVCYGRQRQLEYDFVVAPGADPDLIKMEFRSAGTVALAPSGELRIHTPEGELCQEKPFAYQEIGGDRRPVVCDYAVSRPRPAAEGEAVTFGFRLGTYDRTRPLVIDPVLVYSSFIAGIGADPTGVAVDPEGNTYVVGFTSSDHFAITVGAFRRVPEYSGNDLFVSKLSPDGTTYAYSTYFGGRYEDEGLGIAVDSEGRAYVCGNTQSPDFPTTADGYRPERYPQVTWGNEDAFLTRLSADGSSLSYSTYLGGTGSDLAWGVAVTADDVAYVAGATDSVDLLTTTSALSHNLRGGSEGWIVGVAPNGASLTYASYLGGASDDNIRAVSVDSHGLPCVVGTTISDDFPVTDGSTAEGESAYVARIDPSRPQPVFSTLLGGSSSKGYAVVCGPGDRVYAAGEASGSFPTTPGAFQSGGDGWDAFVVCLSGDGARRFSATLGGSRRDTALGIAVDPAGTAYVTGWTYSRDFPVKNPLQPYFGTLSDAFVTAIEASGALLVFSTTLGGYASDAGRAIALATGGDVMVIGKTDQASYFPTTANSVEPAPPPADAGFVVRIRPDPADGSTLLLASAISGTEADLTWSANPAATSYAVERAQEGDSFTRVGEVAAGTTRFRDTGLQPEGHYLYRLRVTLGSGRVYHTDRVSVVSAAAPQALCVFSPDGSRVELAWEDRSAVETGYRIERAVRYEHYTPIGTAPAGSTSFVDTTTRGDWIYYYRVRAMTGSGLSAPSDPAVVATLSSPVLGAAGLDASAVALGCWSEFTAFDVVQPMVEYERRTEGGPFTRAGVAPLFVDYVDTELQPNTEYYYRARILTDVSASAFSNEVNAPLAPSEVTARALVTPALGVRLTWKDNSSTETGFYIERKQAEEPESYYRRIATVGANVTSYLDTPLTLGTGYTYRIRGFNEFARGHHSEEVSVPAVQVP
jgi:hypothetical protein